MDRYTVGLIASLACGVSFFLYSAGFTYAQRLSSDTVDTISPDVMEVNAFSPKSEEETAWVLIPPQRFPSKRQGLELVEVKLTMTMATFKVQFGGVDIGEAVLHPDDDVVDIYRKVYISDKDEYLLNLTEDDIARNALVRLLYGEVVE